MPTQETRKTEQEQIGRENIIIIIDSKLHSDEKYKEKYNMIHWYKGG